MTRILTRVTGACACTAAMTAILLAACSPAADPKASVVKLVASPGVPVPDLPVPRSILMPKPLPDPDSAYRRSYEFTSDWFTWNIPLWKEVLAPVAGKPNLRYLEIGVYEGRSLVWTMENVLTDPTSKAKVVDAFLHGGVRQRLQRNIQKAGIGDRVEVIAGFSEPVLLKLVEQERGTYDFAYVDGSHAAEDVLLDTLLTWRLLKEGGLLLFDDYGMDPTRSAENRPMVAIDAFVTATRNSVEVVHRGYQVVLRKRAQPPCDYKRRCTRVGDLVYNWDHRTLLHMGVPQQNVALTPEEASALESVLAARRFGAAAEEFYESDLAEQMRSPQFSRIRQVLALRTLSADAAATKK